MPHRILGLKILLDRSMLMVPGPWCLPFIGSAYTFWPIIGNDNVSRLHKVYLKKYRTYGKVVKESVYGNTVVSIFDPKDIEAMFKSEENLNPQRSSNDMLLAIRRSRPDLYSTAGLVPSNGEEWKSLRTSYQDEMLKTDCMNEYLPEQCKLANEFIDSPTMKNDFALIARHSMHRYPLIRRLREWALESTCAVVLDYRVDLKFPQYGRNQLSCMLVDGAEASLDALARAQYSPWWRIMPSYSDLLKTVTDVDYSFYNFISKQVEMEREALPTDRPRCILNKYLANPSNDVKDVITVTSDLIFSGILKTASAMAFFLYNLSENITKQNRLRQEIEQIYPDENVPLTADIIDKMPYLDACLMESFRTFPVTLGTSRILQNNLPLAGHIIPAGTCVLAQNQVAGMLPEYVLQPNDFIPERWLSDDIKPYGFQQFSRPHPFLVLPFGSGPRSCLGKRLTEMQLKVFTILLLKKRKVENDSSVSVGLKTNIINVPNRWIGVAFPPRHRVYM